jgi:hypothetical protein
LKCSDHRGRCSWKSESEHNIPGSIFVLREDGTLIEMQETPYDSEALLQQLLADYSNLLAGDQINPDKPSRWLLVSREMRVPGNDGADRGSLDHLFLDQDAVPTLVKVKRSENTQIRREVVGQMLDYAANGVAFWSVENIRRRYKATCAERNAEPIEKLADFLSPEAFQADTHSLGWSRATAPCPILIGFTRFAVRSISS